MKNYKDIFFRKQSFGLSSGAKVHHIKEEFNKALVLNPKKRVKNFDMTVVEELSIEETPRM